MHVKEDEQSDGFVVVDDNGLVLNKGPFATKVDAWNWIEAYLAGLEGEDLDEGPPDEGPSP